MAERRTDHAADADPVPRDRPDQQASDEPDRWDLPEDRERSSGADASGEDVPDMDEAGAGRRGAPGSGGEHPDRPVPEEPSG